MAKDLISLIIRAVDQTGAAFDSAKRNVQDLGAGVTKLNGLLAGVGVSLSAGAFAAIVKQSIEATAALDDLADTTALTVETLSSLQQTARIGGHSFEMVTGTASKFAKSVAEAAGGNKELLRSFDALGISQERLRTAKFDDLYTEFATKIAKAENKTYAIAYATDLAGKSAAQALPFFKDLAETGLEQSRVTAKQAEDAEKLTKEIGRLRNEFDLLAQSIGIEATPALTRFIQELNLARQATGGFVSGAFLQVISDTNNLPAELKQAQETLSALRAQRSDLAKPSFSNSINNALFDDLESTDSQIAAVQKRVEYLRAVQRQQALARLDGGGAEDYASRRYSASNRTVLPAPGSPGSADTAGPQLIAQLQGQLAELNGETSHVDKAIRKLTDGTKAYSLEVQATVIALAGELDEREKQIALMKLQAEAYDRARAVQESADAITAEFNRTQRESLQNLEFETELLRMNDVQREQAIALRKLENEYRKASIQLEGEERAAYELRMRTVDATYQDARNRLPDAVRANVEGRKLIEEQKRAADESRRVWERFHDDIGRGLTDALMRGFENGKSFGENFWESLKNTAKTTILRPIVQFAVSPITGAITAAMGGVMPGTAGASTGGAGGGGNLLGSLFGGNPMGWITNSAGSGGGIAGGINALSLGADSIFQGLGVGMGSQWIADIGNFGFGVPAMGAITNLLMGNAKGAVGSAALGTLGTMFGGPIGGMIGSAVGSMLGGGKKTAAYLVGRDIPSGSVSYGSGLSADVYGNSQKGDRWHGETWSNVFTSEIRAVYDQIERQANALGFDGGRVRGLSATVSTGSFMDASETFTTVINQVSEQLARQVIPNFSQLVRAGESAAQTLARLSAEAQQASLGRMQAALGLADNTRDLWLSDLSPLSPEARLKEAGLRYNETLNLARSGDASAIAGLSGMSRSYLEQARGYYASGTGYADIFSQVQGDVRGLVNDTLVDQAIAFADIAGSLENVADLLGNVDKRIANQLEAVFKARDIADEVYKKAILQQNAELISQVRDLTQQLARVAA